nr:IS1634 family transposase [Candidatus Sigynarchaeum springense]
MPYLVRKVLKGKTYLYLEEKCRIDGKTKRAWQKYLGPEDAIAQKDLSFLIENAPEKIKATTMSFGVSAAMLSIADDLGLSSIIDAHSKKSRDQGLSLGEYITIAAINRCAAPGSKSKLGAWFSQDWLKTRFAVDPSVLDAQTYWNHFQYLDDSVLDAIELDIGKVIVDKFHLDVDSLLYDPTNFFTFSNGGEGSELLQFGHSKENRNNLRLASYSLVCARESGIPLMHETYAGNVQDAKHFKETLVRVAKRLADLGRDPFKVTLVFDKGNHSDAAFKTIDQQKFGFIVSVRNSTQKDLLQVPRVQLTKTTLPATGKAVEYFKTTRDVYGAMRDVYVVLDPKKHEKHVALFTEKLNEKIHDIESFFKARLNVKKWRTRENVEKKSRSLIGKKPFKDIIKITVGGVDGALTLDIVQNDVARQAYIETLGRTVLVTNRTDWKPETVIWGYREEYIIEHAFRRMKSPTAIAIRPMFHRANTCIKAHVFVCVLGLILLSLARLKLSRKGISTSYEEIIDELRGIHAISIKMPGSKPPALQLDCPESVAPEIISTFKLKTAIRSRPVCSP